ncbi:MAG: tetratricopeptide repeat protein [Acidobacteria bacterium]|nr:tetratricopeptide repeat protein [Acidobacteriota bacterium]MBS1866105.1 tetratricopeptide repeat protein [Acidobacteriota bacterium]
MTHGKFSIARRATAAAALLILAAGFSGCNKLKARDLLNKGVTAFKNGQYDQAVDQFQKAKEADPDLMNARLYLATAYATQYIPGAPSDQNKKLGEQAVAEFKEVLDKDPKNLNAIDGIGSILFQMAGTPYSPAMFEESKKYHQMHIQIKPEDPEPYYWIGVIDWTLSFRGNGELRKDYNEKNLKKQVKETDALPAAVRPEYVAKYGTMIDEGIDALVKAIQIRPDYDDAMAYLNLLYRRKADAVDSADQRADLLKKADDLVDQVKDVKQKRNAQPQPAAS